MAVATIQIPNLPTATALAGTELFVVIQGGVMKRLTSAQLGTYVTAPLFGGLANEIVYQTAPSTTGFIVAPTVSSTVLTWTGSAFAWAAAPTGTVTSVSVTTANGVSGTVATATTTPAITLVLGAIVPTTVNGLTITPTSGTITIANSKTLTNSNTLTLTATDGSTLAIGAGGTLTSAAFTSIGTSGATIPLLNGTNVWSGAQTFQNATVTHGVQQTTRGSIVLANTAGGAYAATLQSSNNATVATTFTLPPDAGSSGQVLRTDGSGVLTWVGGSSGSVTSVSVVTANGVSGSVATATTTPAITLTLGAIVPTSVNGLTISTTTGTFTLTNAKTLSVTNTLTLAGTDSSTLNIGAGGTLASAAFVATGTSGATIPLLNGVNTWSGAQTFQAAATTLGVQQTTQGTLVLANTVASAFATTLQSSNSASAAWTFTFPTTAGTSGYALTTDGSGVTSWALMAASLTRTARTSNTILGASDKGNLIDITANSFSQTFTAAATLGSGWFAYLRNSGTGIVTLDPNAAETIDGLATFEMYTAEVRLIECNGSNFTSQVLHPFFCTYATTSTFVTPPGYTWLGLDLIGAGGGGGSGRRGAAGAARAGGGAGGGGGRQYTRIPSPSAGTTVTATVAAGGTAGAAVGSDTTNGNTAGTGGTTTFGTYASVYGGGGGDGGTASSSTSYGGSGGGAASAGGNGGSNGGAPAYTVSGIGLATNITSQGLGQGGAGAVVVAGSSGAPAEWGGASGGSSSVTATANAGGNSLYGGGGGGAGGGITTGNAGQTGGAGGQSSLWDASGTAGGSYTGGGGGAGGATGSGGTAGANYTAIGSGYGSGGGGGHATTPGAGANGGLPGGGAGGGGASTNGAASGAGGVGGRGEVRIWGIA